ncbi:MAG: molybdopterin molybdotransferase MoeA, partial [Candidatus Aminicenantales bacterium]
LRPQEIAVAASMGLTKIKVFRRPEVGIMTTGSEIVQPGKKLNRGQIYDSNTYSLAAQVFQAGAIVKTRQTAVDSPQEIRHWLKKLIESCDVVLVSGGVSVGDYDYVPAVLKELGVRLHFEKIAIKPGKPTVFGSRGKTFIFGVPGNPVSTFVIFELFIKPLLLRMMAHEWQPVIIKAILAQEIYRKRSERSAFYPVLYKEGQVYPLPYHGSAHIHALTKANGLICLPRGQEKIVAGSSVDVRQI